MSMKEELYDKLNAPDKKSRLDALGELKLMCDSRALTPP